MSDKGGGYTQNERDRAAGAAILIIAGSILFVLAAGLGFFMIYLALH